MNRAWMIRLAAGAIAASTVGGCAANPRPRVGVAYVQRRPPAERIEVMPAPPGPEYAWVKGHWGWRRDDYEWIPGHWTIPDRGFREWVPGRWDHDRNGWFYVEGHWR